MKNQKKVISYRTNKIVSNNLKVISYTNENEIECSCNKCNYEIVDNYRNLSYNKFKCKYCTLIDESELIKNGSIKILKINGSLIKVKCKNNHEYVQDRRNLLAKKGCHQCYLNRKSVKKENIIDMFIKIHGKFYKYDISTYKTLHSKITITCKKGHTFKQKTSNHLQGKGCPICRESLGERIISNFLEKNKIQFIRQKK